MVEKFKYIQGSVLMGEPAQITFFSDVNGWRVEDFVYELNYLDQNVHPSEIQILINSGGGNCVDGITAFAAIRNAKTRTKCINVGLAASMASIIWAAGDEGYMYDYAMLMIHCPWTESDNDDPKTKQVLTAFKQQLKTIYMKRFGLDEEKVVSIMEGKQDEDGTWYQASEAVAAGFLPTSHVIETDKQIQASVRASLEGVKNIGAIKAVMSSVITEHKPFESESTIEEKTPNGATKENSNTQQMNEELKLVCSQLGLSENAKMADVSAKLIELNGMKAQLDKANADLKTAKDTVASLQTQLAGETTAKQNLQSNLDAANASLKVYQDKEEAEKTSTINALVEEAVKTGKITAEAKEQWVAMAKSNLEMVKVTLASIPARTKLSAEVNNTPEAKSEAEEAAKTEEEKVAEKVQAVLGGEYKFRTFDED